ncbi:MAG: ABC transporter substrate-binding protein [Desulfobulbaceae bacterium]|nr:ABC transporter substrate-binding protein [Desulfobulbaceae bacterium]
MGHTTLGRPARQFFWPGLSLVFACAAAFTVLAAASAQAREIVDMAGHKRQLPNTIHKVVAISPPGTYLLYAVAPDLLAGLNFPLWESEKKYTSPAYRKLPVIGGIAGQGRTINREALLAVRPDFILHWTWKEDAAENAFRKSMAGMPFPLVSVKIDDIFMYPSALRFVGDVTGRKERGEALAAYADKTLAEAKVFMAAIPDTEKARVYYAEGPDGLATERADSLHAELIPLAGGINVHPGTEFDHYGMEKITMEQLLLYNPDVILVKEKSFFARVYQDARWKNLKAVRERRVFLIPYEPFNWFDRPPSFMRILGIKWLLNLLHPERGKIDMIAETKAFYKLFLGAELSDSQAKEVLCR